MVATQTSPALLLVTVAVFFYDSTALSLLFSVTPRILRLSLLFLAKRQCIVVALVVVVTRRRRRKRGEAFHGCSHRPLAVMLMRLDFNGNSITTHSTLLFIITNGHVLSLCIILCFCVCLKNPLLSPFTNFPSLQHQPKQP